jgi:hypothetical protein
MTVKSLGKITEVGFGYGGYQDAQFGITIYMWTPDGSIHDFKGPWANRRETAEYSLEAWNQQKADLFDFLRNLLHDAKTDDLSGLKGKPIEVTFEGLKMTGWRILTEVL